MLQVDEYSLKERFEMKYSWCRQTSSCLLGVLHCMHMWATAGHHYVYVDYYSKLPVTGCRPSDVQSMLGWQGWSCPRIPYHEFERRCACFFSYDISSWYNMIVLHTPGLSGRSSKQSSFGYNSTAVEGYERCSGYDGSSIFTSSTTGQYLTKVWIQTPGPELSRRFDRVRRRCASLVPYDYWLFSSGFLVLVDPPELFC